MTTPRGGDTPEAAQPRVRKAAVEKAMRKRERRLAATPDKPPAERSERPVRTRVARDRPARQRPPRGSTVRERRTERARPQPAPPAGAPTRRRVLIRRGVALGAVAVLAAIVVAVLWTPLLGVRSVDVSGNRQLTVAQIVAAARVPTGTPMARLDTSAIEQRVARLPRVAAVDVAREWPSSVRIDVTERDPIGYLVRPDGRHLVDDTGLDYATVGAAPPGLPILTLPSVSPDDQRTQAVLAVLAALPQQLRPLLVTVGANTPGSVTLGLGDGRTIRWGSADDSARKAQVLAALMSQPGKVYDVSSPDLPTIS